MQTERCIPPRIRQQQRITRVVVEMRQKGIPTTAEEVKTFLLNENDEDGRDFLMANFRPEFVEAMINREN